MDETTTTSPGTRSFSRQANPAPHVPGVAQEQVVASLQQEVLRLQEKLAAIESTWSWSVTAPYRWVASHIRRVVRSLREEHRSLPVAAPRVPPAAQAAQAARPPPAAPSDRDPPGSPAPEGSGLAERARRWGWVGHAVARAGLGPGKGPREVAACPAPGPDQAGRAGREAPLGAGTGPWLATVVTRGYLPFARSAVGSFLRHHPGARATVLVVDVDSVAGLAVEGAEVLAGREVMGDELACLALKYDATELCCAAKPWLVEYLARRRGASRIVYLDSDILVFEPMGALLEALERSDFVVTPHLLAPFPARTHMDMRPSLGDIAGAGQLNAGIFGMRATGEALAFVRTWRDLVTGPGAFRPALGLQHEQNYFNWVTCFSSSVHVLRDPAYNVAYWNLHDRSLRVHEPDGPGPERVRWTVDGRPLVAYHFSGLDPARPRHLSRHDGRHSLYLLPAVARLVETYLRGLASHGLVDGVPEPSRRDRLASGLPVSRLMRDVFKAWEAGFPAGQDPWTPAGERAFCQMLLRPAAGSGSMLPAILKTIYDSRPDLMIMSPDADTRPETVIRWLHDHGCREFGLDELVGRHAPRAPGRKVLGLLESLARRRPELLAGLPAPLGPDRARLIERLRLAGLADEVGLLGTQADEPFDLGSIYLARRTWELEPGLKERFPDPLGADAAGLAAWFDGEGGQSRCLPADLSAALLLRAGGKAMARILSFVARTYELQRGAPLGFVGVGTRVLVHALLRILHHDLEFDFDDVVAFMWDVETAPWRGVGPTLELAVHRVRDPSSYTREGQDAILAPVIGQPLMRAELEAYRARQGAPGRQPGPGPDGPACPELSVLVPLPATAGPGRPTAPSSPAPGVNVFGFFKSPIGLGTMSRGLVDAIRTLGLPVAENVEGNIAMARDLSIEDLVGTYDHRLGTNVFVSYPHLHDRLLGLRSRRVVEGRRNIAYLAWEQRDASPFWKEVYSGFEEVWALSTFAASGLANALGRDVLPVPCVVDPTGFPPPASKEAFGLDPREFLFLYVFDANSSVVRKNPEAAVAAFAEAFRRDDPARLVLRASNAGRAEHRLVLRRLEAAAAASGARISLLDRPMSRAEILGLLSAADCYVSLHRAEGFGYTCAEAMGYGRPVIATRYSGNLDFMDADNSLLVDCREVEVDQPDGPFMRGSLWAEPSVAHAAELMRRVYEGAVPGDLGARARQTVLERLSAAAIGQRIAARLCRAEVRRTA